MKIAITGSSGYLGSYLSKRLVEDGYEVKNFQRKKTKSKKNTEYTYFDLTKEIKYDFTTIDVLIFTAYDFQLKKDAQINDINIFKTVKLINNAKLQGVKKVFFISTLSSFEGCKSKYGMAKLEVEKKIKDTNTFIIKPGIIVGREFGGIAKTLDDFSDYYVLPLPYKKETFMYITCRNSIYKYIHSHLDNKNYNFETKILVDTQAMDLISLIKNLNRISNKKNPIFIKVYPFIFYLLLYLFQVVYPSTRIGVDNLSSLLNTKKII